jgi:hypothetical protein
MGAHNNFREDDTKWPQKNKDGRQELEIRLGNEHISFEVRYSRYANLQVSILTTETSQTAKIGSLVDVNESEDPEGLRVFYYLVQDLKALVFSLISLHFKVRAMKPSSPTQLLTHHRSSQFEPLALAFTVLGAWSVELRRPG